MEVKQPTFVQFTLWMIVFYSKDLNLSSFPNRQIHFLASSDFVLANSCLHISVFQIPLHFEMKKPDSFALPSTS